MHANTVELVLAYWRGRELEPGPSGIVSVVTIDREQFVLAPERVRPRFAERLKQYGMQLPRVFFE